MHPPTIVAVVFVVLVLPPAGVLWFVMRRQGRAWRDFEQQLGLHVHRGSTPKYSGTLADRRVVIDLVRFWFRLPGATVRVPLEHKPPTQLLVLPRSGLNRWIGTSFTSGDAAFDDAAIVRCRDEDAARGYLTANRRALLTQALSSIDRLQVDENEVRATFSDVPISGPALIRSLEPLVELARDLEAG